MFEKKSFANEEVEPQEEILHHAEGIDLMLEHIELFGLEVSLVNIMSWETILKEYINLVRDRYSFILIDCTPSLGMVTINALATADSVLIPVQAAYLPAKGLEQLIKTIRKVKRQINPKLEIEGILLTMLPPEEENPSMYVLSNAERLNGAAAILDAKTMEDISEKLGGDFVVLPSSIHETIVLPMNEDMDRQALETMVQDVNAGQVAPEERLSDHVYMYDSQEKEHKMEERK